MITNNINYDYSISVFIAAKDTPSPIEPSAGGHIWIGLEDYTNGYRIDNYGFESGENPPKAQGRGNISLNDNEHYAYTAYTIKFPLTKEQYDKVNDFVLKAQIKDSKGQTWGGYGCFKNSCVDFTFAALRAAGIGVERDYVNEDGRMIPMMNISGLEDIHQNFLNNQGYPGETKYWEYSAAGTEQYLASVTKNVGDSNQLAIKNEGDTQNRGLQEQPIKIDEIIKTAVAVSDLPRNPHSKVLFDAYGKAALVESGQGWTAEMNKTIVENMLADGRTPQRIVDALKHSPEPIENTYYFVKDIRNSPEMVQTQQSRSVGRGIC